MGLVVWVVVGFVVLWVVLGVIAGFITLSADYYEDGSAATTIHPLIMFILMMTVAILFGPFALWLALRDLRNQKIAWPRIAKYGLIFSPGQARTKLQKIRAKEAMTT